jgi:hypothetical protein
MAEISGQVFPLSIRTGEERKYGFSFLSFADLFSIVQAEQFHLESGQGQHRPLYRGHLHKIIRGIERGLFIPNSFVVGFDENQRRRLKFEENKFFFEINSGEKLPLLDGQHRLFALYTINEEYPRIDTLQLPIIFLFDHSLKQAFLASNSYLPLGRTLIKNIKAIEPQFESNLQERFCNDCLSILNKNHNSPFYLQIGGRGILTEDLLTRREDYDLSLSLIGGYLICETAGQTAQWYCNFLLNLYTLIKVHLKSYVLTPPPVGNKNNALLYLGITNIICYKIIRAGFVNLNEDELVDCLKWVFNKSEADTTNKVACRKLITEFAAFYLSSLSCATFERIPLGLLKTLSYSTFDLKERKRKKYEDQQEDI